MKKIWLRKEREDSKSQQESKSGSSNCTFKETEVTPSQPSDDIEKSKSDSDGIAEQNSRTESEIREKEDSRSSKTSQKFSSALPESTNYQESFYHLMDASRIHPAYILAVQGAMDPYQLQRQIHFAVPSPFPFMPVAQMKKYVSNGSHYDLPRVGNYDSYLVQSSGEDRRFSGQSAVCERGRETSESGESSSQNRSKFDYSHFSYSLKASFQRQSDEYRLGSDPKNLRPTFPRPEPFASQVRKRAPNSPLEVPITPTTLPGHDSVSVFPRAFVVPRNMMRLSVGEEGTDSGSRRTAEVTVGILPTVIANMTELEVNDDDKLTKPSSYNNNNYNSNNYNSNNNNNCNSNNNNNYNSINNNIKEATTSSSSTTTHQFANNVPNFRPYESIVAWSSSSSSSSSSLNGSDTHPVGKTEHRVTFKMDERREANDKGAEEHRDRLGNNNNNNNNNNNINNNNNNIINNNINNNNIINNNINNNNRETRSNASTGHPKERLLGNAVAMPTGDDSVSNGDATKDNPVVTTTVTASRGKGRPAKTVGKPGADLPSAGGGLRSVIKCPTCMKVFNNSSALAKHKLTHSDERKYSCHLCSKAFKRQDHLNGHMMTHSSKKPFECKFLGCTKSYCDARSLRRHLENHHHDSINSCNGAGFMPGRTEEGRPAAQSLVRPDSCTHLPQLSDDAWNSKVVWAPGFNPLDEPKPVRCHVCGRRFKNVPALNGHMRLHGGYVNRDTEDEIDKQSDNVTTSLEIAKRKSWEAKTKAFEEKPNYHHASDVIGHERASSLERLSSSSSSSTHGGGGCLTSMTPWDLSKDELERVKFKSYSLPREELKYKERGPLWSENNSGQSEKLQDWKTQLIGRDSSSKMRDFPLENARSASSAVIDLTNDEALQANQRVEFVNDLKKEAASKSIEKMPRDVESFHYSKYSNGFQTIAAVQSSKGHFEETTMDLSNKSRCLDGGSEISPKHLEASSLYQRRLRRFSERSPNSDESSRHSGGTPSPLNLEKFAEEEEEELGQNDFADRILRGSNNVLLDKMVSHGEKNEFFAAPNSQVEAIEETNSFQPSRIHYQEVVNSATCGDLKQWEAKASSSSYPGFYQNNTSGDSYCKTVCSSISVQHGQSVENPNVSLQHQSHSSLPCTPYTAHTPYTPRTTEPSSPRQAGFFQFPPNQQHEGSKIPSMEAPSISAFDHENPMETARIPEVQSGDLPQDCGSATSEKSVNKKQGGDRKPSDCKTRRTLDETKVCDRSRASFYEKVSSSSQEWTSSSSEDAAHLNYLKARGKIVERSVTQIKSETSALQEKQKEKLSARRKAKPAPLVLPPQKETRERYATCRGREADDSMSSDHRPRAPSPVLPGSEQSGTAVRRTLSSVDSGCPKSSARFSVNETPSGFLPQSGDSLVFNHLKEHRAASSARDFQIGQKTRQQAEISGERTKDSLSEVSINIGTEYQATIPQLEDSRCFQKEKSELWLTGKKDWPDTLKGRLQVNQGMHPILLHLDKGPPR